ncbi:MAG TPA: alpha-ribazole phosphatase family protein [Zoogloea sp.]|uniref:alpha-ribazole phosphatase family protein n=1 Tax=Zoogloea sp. TaxID=49181 RepID=UPI002C09F611|nr:alpha-ribazole phosphatase family protein [Zoogloea sp.]HOB46072.1 alpha-ribazole phosphatase family protein [Zoogloea sp.]HQA09999.1 alpha-ribazole phosphatase family protein [Zoogloea sp.]HQE38847.1 alpha-ribazole phosphatase family protein [Zoogloea sp.]
MELYLIRHPRPAVEPGICYGQTDLGLAEPVDAVAARLRPLLPESFALYASPLRRARLLAEALGTPQLDPRLKEIHFGDWEGRSFDDIGQAALDAWAAAPLDFAPPGGESPRQMSARAHAFLADLCAAPSVPAAVVVAHGGPLRALAGKLLGLPPERWLGLDFACGEATRIDLHHWGTVLRWFNR